jgi:hypothetical protein
MNDLNIDLFDIVWEQADNFIGISWRYNIMNQIYCSNEIYISLYLSICFLILLFFAGGKS